ncbi:MAG TPA: hypothetical protein VGR47_21945 [Terracidiphilus sp.]|nr:hypothetical protein [Terracidiphilus sp.]
MGDYVAGDGRLQAWHFSQKVAMVEGSLKAEIREQGSGNRDQQTVDSGPWRVNSNQLLAFSFQHFSRRDEVRRPRVAMS